MQFTQWVACIIHVCNTIFEIFVEDSNLDDGFGYVCVYELAANHCTVLSDTCISNRFKLYQYWKCIISSLHGYIQVNEIITGIYVLLNRMNHFIPPKSFRKVFNAKYTSRVCENISTSIKYAVFVCVFFVHYTLNSMGGMWALNMLLCEKLLKPFKLSYIITPCNPSAWMFTEELWLLVMLKLISGNLVTWIKVTQKKSVQSRMPCTYV